MGALPMLLTAGLLKFYSLTLRTVNSTTPNPSLLRRGVSLATQVVSIPRLSKEGLGVVVRKVSYSVKHNFQ